jgi:outer membrane protein assembly factor BamB
MKKLGFSLCLAAMAVAADWPRYRGPNGTGIGEAMKLPAELGKEKNVAWKASTVKGNSSPIVIKDRLFFTGHEGDERILFCFDAVKGTELWRRAVTKARVESGHPLNGPTTPTPATDGRNVFAFFPDFGLVAYDFAGKEQWRVPMGPFAPIQGLAASPIYTEGNVVLLIDTPQEAYLVAFNSRTGEEAWRRERPTGFLGSYSTPSLYEPKSGPAQIIVAGGVELTGYQAKTGERLWWANGVTSGPAALPLISGDSVFTLEPAGEDPPTFASMPGQYDANKDGKLDIAAEMTGTKLNDEIYRRIFKGIDRNAGNGDGVLTVEEWDKSWDPKNPAGGLVRTKLGGKGDVTKTHVGWRQRKSLPYVTAPLLLGGTLYVVRNGGILAAYRAESGELIRQERLKDAPGEYYASPVFADGKMYFASKDGKVTVIKPDAAGSWETLASADLDEQIIATPAIAGNRIYIRTDRTLYCFGS